MTDAGLSTKSSAYGPLSSQEVAELAQHLAMLANQGLPLEKGLRAMSLEVPSRRLRNVLQGVAGELERGASLDQALATAGRNLPEYLRGLVMAGIRTGRLGQVLDEYAFHCHFSQELRRRAWMALTYPLLLAVLSAGFFLFFERLLVPQLGKVYDDFEIELPALTRGLLWLSQGIPWIVLGGCLGLLATWLTIRWRLSAAVRRRLICRLPVIGPLWRFAATAELANFAALVLESNVPLPVALDLAGQSVGDADLADSCCEVRREIEQGRRLSECEACRLRFPAGLAQILRWSEGHNDLPAALRGAANAFAGRARLQSDLLRVVAPMLSLMVMVAVFSYLVLALFLPLISLIETLS